MKDQILDDNNLVVKYCRDAKLREKVLSEIFRDKNFLSKVKEFIISHGGKNEDYEDILNDGLLAFIKICLNPKFELHTKTKAYIFGIIKNLWFGNRRRNQIKQKVFDIHEESIDGEVEPSVEEILIKKERKVVLKQLLSNLDNNCKKILTMWSFSLKMKEISSHFENSTEGQIRKRKHDCLKKLNKIIQSNPQYKIALT